MAQTTAPSGCKRQVGSIPTLGVLRDGEPNAAQAGLAAAPLVEALDRLAAAPAAGQEAA